MSGHGSRRAAPAVRSVGLTLSLWIASGFGGSPLFGDDTDADAPPPPILAPGEPAGAPSFLPPPDDVEDPPAPPTVIPPDAPDDSAVPPPIVLPPVEPPPGGPPGHAVPTPHYPEPSPYLLPVEPTVPPDYRPVEYWLYGGIPGEDYRERFIIKSGLVFPLGGEFFEDRLKIGWTIQAAVREWISPPSRGTQFFIELGGGYAGNSGRGSRAITPGVFYAPPDDHFHPLDRFFASEIEQLHRASAHFAFGGVVSPVRWSDPCERRVELIFRGGPRIGHVRADLDKDPTAELVEVAVEHGPPPLGHGHDPALYVIEHGINETDTFWGLFGSVGLQAVWYDVECQGLHFREVAFGGELELVHDWFSLGTLGRNDRGLLTMSAMLTLSILK